MIKNHDEQYLQANIAIVEEQAAKGKINNIAAYLLKSFQDDYRQEETEYSKQQKKSKAEIEKAKVEQTAAEQAREERRKQFLEERKTKLNAVKEKLTDIEIIELKAEFETEMMQTDFFSQIYKTKGFEHGVIQQQRDRFLVGRFLASFYGDFDEFERFFSEKDKV